ncbi:MAG: hypothetical protein U9R27_06360 [Campylobacterota bacterium]|nr:hypothetical protein [Campylobacterota bacterium]
MTKHIRIEWLAIGMILLMLAVSYLIKAKNEKAKQNISTKEVEVFNSITIEVNTTAVVSRLYTDYSVKENGQLILTNLDYTGKRAKELKSRYGRNRGDLFYLDENVTLLQKSGYSYKAEHAIYDKEKDLFYITSPFVAYINKNIIKGVNLKYDIKEEIATAERVDAVFYTGKDR